MLHHIQTPRVLIASVYSPETVEYDHGRGDRGTQVSHYLLIEIDAEAEAMLPDYAKAKVSPYSWHGVPEGTRGIKLSSGKSRPVVFGVSAGDVLMAQSLNIDLDQLLRNRPATVCISMGGRKGRDGGQWPILRSLHLWAGLVFPAEYRVYTESMASHWEFKA